MTQKQKTHVDRKYLHSQAPWTLTNGLIDRVKVLAVKHGWKASQWVETQLLKAVEQEEANEEEKH